MAVIKGNAKCGTPECIRNACHWESIVHVCCCFSSVWNGCKIWIIPTNTWVYTGTKTDCWRVLLMAGFLCLSLCSAICSYKTSKIHLIKHILQINDMLTSQILSVEKSLAVLNTKIFLKVREFSGNFLREACLCYSSKIAKVMAIHAKSCYIINKKWFFTTNYNNYITLAFRTGICFIIQSHSETMSQL